MLQSGRKQGLGLVRSTLRMWMWMVGGVCGAGALRCASVWCGVVSVGMGLRYGSNGVERTSEPLVLWRARHVLRQVEAHVN